MEHLEHLTPSIFFAQSIIHHPSSIIHHPSSIIHHHPPCSKCSKIYSLFQTFIFFKDKINLKIKSRIKKNVWIKGIILEHWNICPAYFFCPIPLAEFPIPFRFTPSLLSSPNLCRKRARIAEKGLGLRRCTPHLYYPRWGINALLKKWFCYFSE